MSRLAIVVVIVMGMEFLLLGLFCCLLSLRRQKRPISNSACDQTLPQSHFESPMLLCHPTKGLKLERVLADLSCLMRGATKFWYLVSGTGLMPSSSVVLPQDTSGMRKVEIYAPDKNMNGNTLEITITNEMGLCLSHMFFLASSHTKNIKREKCFRHIEIMIFTTIFLNCVFNTRNEKKSYFTL